MSTAPLRLVGGHGSPYSRKMRAVLRYRQIPFRWIHRGSAQDVGTPEVPVALIPTGFWRVWASLLKSRKRVSSPMLVVVISRAR